MHLSHRIGRAATLLAGIVAFSCGSGSSASNGAAGFGGTAGLTGSSGSNSGGSNTTTGGNSSSGGTTATGGSNASGGKTSSGGTSSGGTSTGGTSTGGTGTGGKSTGGTNTGGTSTGGTSTGGTSTGGTSTGGAATGGTTSGGLPGPLVVSSNPNYFKDTTGHAVVLAGSHTWNDFQDWGGSALQTLDFAAYTQFLVAHGQNFTLLWRTELPKFCGLPTTDTNPPNFITSPQPWPRTGPGNANDGGLKFDLNKFDTAYFDRLRSRVSALNTAGIWVGVYLFSGEWLSAFRCTGDGYPLSAANNINSIDDGGGNGSMSMSAPNAITAIQDAMVNKTIDTLNDLPNVLWIVSEEAASNTTWWQSHMIAHIHSYEANKPFRHPVGLAAITGLPDTAIYNSDADWVAPFTALSPTTTCGTGTPQCKVNVNDSDHSYFGMWNDSPQKNRQFAWQNFARGNHVAFMDPYVVYYPRQGRNMCVSPNQGICSAPDPRWNNFRDNLGYIVRYSKKLDLDAVRPSTSLCSTSYCLAQTSATGTEYLVYAPNGGSFSVDLSKATGRTLKYEWFDPSKGSVAATGTVSGGTANQNFSTPSSITTDSVLYLVDSAGHG